MVSYGRCLCCWASFTLRAVLATLRAIAPHGVVLGVGSHPSMHLATRRLARRQGGTGLSGGAVGGHLRAHVHWRGAGETASQKGNSRLLQAGEMLPYFGFLTLGIMETQLISSLLG